MANGTRMADKLRNAFTIDIMTVAQTALEDRTALPLVDVSSSSGGPQDGEQTYAEKRDDKGPLIMLLIAIAAILFLVWR